MSSLFEFPNLPPGDEINVCLIDGKLYSLPPNIDDITCFTKTIQNYPKIFITRDMLHGSLNREESGRNVFLPVSETTLKRFISAWYEQGFIEALHIAANPTHQHFSLLTGSAKFALKAIDTFNSFYRKIHPQIHESGIQLIASISHTNGWSNSPIRCIAWHPRCVKLAVATLDDSIRIFSIDSALVPILKCKKQKGITCMEWRPLSASELAVGCENGIIIWTIDPNSVVTRPSSSNAQFLEAPGHSHVVDVAWRPIGDLLASAAASDSTLRIWDVATARSETLRRTAGGGLSLLKWSPDGTKLFSSSVGIVFRIWNCIDWIAERWDVGTGRVQAACWSPCGTVLLFSTDQEPNLFALQSTSSGVWAAKNGNGLSKEALPILNLSKISECEKSIGGMVRQLCWDSSGKHLAILFKEGNAVAVFRTSMRPVLQIAPCCLVTGLAYEKPSIIAFQKNFEKGSCLTICWSSGRLQYFPLIESY